MAKAISIILSEYHYDNQYFMRKQFYDSKNRFSVLMDEGPEDWTVDHDGQSESPLSDGPA